MLKPERRYRFILLLTLISLTGLWGCNEVIPEEPLPSGGVPVEFSFEGPAGYAGTRGVEAYKKLFDVGDVIHIQATFTHSDNLTTTAYGAMQLSQARKWVPVEGSELYWPFDAVKGTFKAYYVYSSRIPLTPGHPSSSTVSLSDIKDDQDPLEAEKKDVKYGNAVSMQFTHACTHLTLERLEQNVTDYYWMVFNGEKKIKNAFRLILGDDNELNLEFTSIEDHDYADAVYVSRRSESMTVEDSEGSKTYSKVSFYLAPGSYNSFELRTNNNFPYMSFNNSIPDELLANHPYVLRVDFAKGADFVTSTDEDWDKSEEAFKVDVSEFLDAVRNGREYTGQADNGEDVPVLKSVNGTLVLLRNLDFNFYEDYAGLGFDPDVLAGTVLDGNLHYIENIAHPVFRFNYGTIQNLGLRNMVSEVTAFETEDSDEDYSRIGGLCLRNRQDAIIRNIRMEKFNLTVKIKAEDPRGGRNSNDNFSIGGLCGDNLSTISDISVKGDIIINVRPLGDKPEDDYFYVDANINIGGIVGNHTKILSDVGPQPDESFSVTIINSCSGRDEWGSGVFCLGGAVGQSTANEISRVVMRNVSIEAKDSDGYQQYIGGLAGRLRGSSTADTRYFVSDCTVDGSVTCGTVSRFGETATSPSIYVGGISGNARDYDISNCRAVCRVDATNDRINDQNNAGATYATGGAIGLIQSGVTLSGNSAYGSFLAGLQEGTDITARVGNFAGIARTNYSWNEFAKQGNTARILTNASGTPYEMIGDFLESGSDE